MAFILPKGIVVNSAQIGRSIERIDTQPLDTEDIARVWKVYTTTKRRLLDPTAERLENYWWRIWGSRKRELSGATVARLFAYISDGHSFVPLLGPMNRHEEPVPSHRQAGTTLPAPGISTIEPDNSSRQSTNSISKISGPMLPPILKKTRGPSSTEARPTARFVSPHESEVETASAVNSLGSSISPKFHFNTKSAFSDLRLVKVDKTSGMPGGTRRKARVVALTSAKKRPNMPKRQSSQSSTDSCAKIESHIVTQNSISPSAGKPLDGLQTTSGSLSRFNENSSGRWMDSQSPARTATSVDEPASSVLASQNQSQSNRKRDPENITRNELSLSRMNRHNDVEDILELKRRHSPKSSRQGSSVDPRAHRSDDLKNGKPSCAQQIRGSTSGENIRIHDLTAMPMKSAPFLAPTLTAAMGQLDLAAPELLTQSRLTDSTKKDKDSKEDPAGDKKQISAVHGTASLTSSLTKLKSKSEQPMARSKSQLSLLLQKDRARNDEKRS